MNEIQFKELLNKIDLLVKLQGINVVNQIKTDKDKILILSDLGLSPKEINNITGIRIQYIYDIRSQNK